MLLPFAEVSGERSNVCVGCCGFAMAQEKYLRAIPSVEIDSSFYTLPKLPTAARWREAAPRDFQFALKAWQLITHRASSPTYKRTRLDPRDAEYCGHFGYNPTVRWAWNETFAVARELNAFLVLFQCPASFRPTQQNLRALKTFFERAKRGKFLMGWEPRGEWEAELVASLCRELDLIHVVDPFKSPAAVERKIRYFRLHGVSGTRHRFSNEELHRLKTMCAGKLPCYCMFNNLSMTDEAQRLLKIL